MAMTKAEKQKYLEYKTIGHWDCNGGLELKAYDDAYAIVVANAWTSEKRVHRLKIMYSRDDCYILHEGIRFYFSACSCDKE